MFLRLLFRSLSLRLPFGDSRHLFLNNLPFGDSRHLFSRTLFCNLHFGDLLRTLSCAFLYAADMVCSVGAFCFLACAAAFLAAARALPFHSF